MASACEKQPERRATHPPGAQASVRTRSLRAGQRRLPSWLSLVLIALTCVCLLASTVTIWVETTILIQIGLWHSSRRSAAIHRSSIV